jgi:hypothetical protein
MFVTDWTQDGQAFVDISLWVDGHEYVVPMHLDPPHGLVVRTDPGADNGMQILLRPTPCSAPTLRRIRRSAIYMNWCRAGRGSIR